jgi:hypothetical protein
MNGRILPFDARRHGEALRLLPWLVTGRLDDEERAWVEQHAAGCSDCRRELEELHALRDACRQAAGEPGEMDADLQARTPVATSGADADWRRLRARLQPPQRVHEPRWRPPHWQWRQRPRWLGWAVAAQALTITLLGAAWWRSPAAPTAPAQYRTLGATPAVAVGNLVIVFDPRLDESRLRGLLLASEARIVDGPNEAGAYVLAVPPARLPMVRDALRAAPGVTLVASLGPEGTP